METYHTRIGTVKRHQVRPVAKSGESVEIVPSWEAMTSYDHPAYRGILRSAARCEGQMPADFFTFSYTYAFFVGNFTTTTICYGIPNRTQNPVLVTECRFDPVRPHQHRRLMAATR